MLDELTIDEYKKFDKLFEEDLYGEISLSACVQKRTSAGGTGARSVEQQIKFVEEFIK